MIIIVVDNSLAITGAFNAIYKNALTSPHQFIYYIPDNSKNKSLLESQGITVYTFKSREISRNIVNLLLYLPQLIINGYKLSKIVVKHKAQWIYQNEIFILSGIMARMFVKVGVISHFRVMPTIFPAKLFKAWIYLQNRFSDRLVTVSFVCKKAITALYPTKKELTVLYDFILPVEYLPPYAVDSKIPARLLFLGNYTEGKGQDIAIDALAALIKLNTMFNVELHCYGSHFNYPSNVAYLGRLKELAVFNKIEEQVFFHDFSDNVEQVMKEGDILLNLSGAESFSFVVAEGLFYGIPIVATDSGGPGELIEDGKSGYLTQSNSDAVAVLIAKLLDDTALRSSFSAAGKIRIRQLINIHGGAEKFNDLFSIH